MCLFSKMQAVNPQWQNKDATKLTPASCSSRIFGCVWVKCWHLADLLQMISIAARVSVTVQSSPARDQAVRPASSPALFTYVGQRNKPSAGSGTLSYLNPKGKRLQGLHADQLSSSPALSSRQRPQLAQGQHEHVQQESRGAQYAQRQACTPDGPLGIL